MKGDFLVEDIENLSSIKDNNYDLVYSFGVIHHTNNPEKAIENAFRVLKEGGIFKLMMYAKNSWKKIMIDNGYDRYEAQQNCPIVKTYEKGEIKEILESYGFKNISIFQTHIFPYKIAEYKQNIFVKEDWFESMPEEMFEALKKSLGWHLCITAIK